AEPPLPRVERKRPVADLDVLRHVRKRRHDARALVGSVGVHPRERLAVNDPAADLEARGMHDVAHYHTALVFPRLRKASTGRGETKSWPGRPEPRTRGESRRFSMSRASALIIVGLCALACGCAKKPVVREAAVTNTTAAPVGSVNVSDEIMRR